VTSALFAGKVQLCEHT